MVDRYEHAAAYSAGPALNTVKLRDVAELGSSLVAGTAELGVSIVKDGSTLVKDGTTTAADTAEKGASFVNDGQLAGQSESREVA